MACCKKPAAALVLKPALPASLFKPPGPFAPRDAAVLAAAFAFWRGRYKKAQ